MTDLIDRQAVIDALEKDWNGMVVEFNFIRDLPSADAVEVVRCKGCKHYRDYGCQRAFVYPKPDDFCSYGERKDGNGNG